MSYINLSAPLLTAKNISTSEKNINVHLAYNCNYVQSANKQPINALSIISIPITTSKKLLLKNFTLEFKNNWYGETAAVPPLTAYLYYPELSIFQSIQLIFGVTGNDLTQALTGSTAITGFTNFKNHLSGCLYNESYSETLHRQIIDTNMVFYYSQKNLYISIALLLNSPSVDMDTYILLAKSKYSGIFNTVYPTNLIGFLGFNLQLF